MQIKCWGNAAIEQVNLLFVGAQLSAAYCGRYRLVGQFKRQYPMKSVTAIKGRAWAANHLDLLH